MKTIIHMIVTLTVIGVIAGGLLFMVSDWANPLIAATCACSLGISCIRA